MEETIDLSNDVRDESAVKFETYRNYLARVCEYLDEQYGAWEVFAGKCYDKTRPLQARPTSDVVWIERFLQNAWNTETLLGEQPDDAELIRINNQWLPIQAYYAVYAAAEAAVAAINGERAGSHQKCLTQITSYMVNSGLTPWSCAYTGACGRDEKQHRPVKFPPDVQPSHNLRLAGVRPIDLIATCLRAEHKHRAQQGYKRAGAYKYAYDPGHTSLFHFLYRLRCKSNYKDVEVFITEAPESSILEFSESLRRLTMWSVSYCEIILIRKCRRSVIQEIASRFIARNKRTHVLQGRLAFYATAN